MGKVGINVTIARELENILLESGDFSSVKSIKQTIPIGPWHPGDVHSFHIIPGFDWMWTFDNQIQSWKI
jgi:hypothetical protein